jgi:hypothetical protein
MSFSIKNLGFNKVAVLENGKQIHVCSGPNSLNEAKQYISESYTKTAPKAVKRGNITSVVAEMQAIQDNIGSFEMSMVEGYTAEQINTLIENYSSFTQTNEEVQNPSLTAWIGRHHYTQKTYVESMDEPEEKTMPATDKWQAKEQDPKSFTNTVTRAASTITISQQKAGLYGHGPFGITRDFETKVEPNPYVGKTQLSGPNESVETLDEISKKTTGEYIKSAAQDKMMAGNKLGVQGSKLSIPDAQKLIGKINKRTAGIDKAVSRLTKEDITEAELDEMISEVLGKSAEAGKWIEDFVNSDNPKFEGKSKEKRKQMALAAYYAKQNEELELDEASNDVAELRSHMKKSGYSDDNNEIHHAVKVGNKFHYAAHDADEGHYTSTFIAKDGKGDFTGASKSHKSKADAIAHVNSKAGMSEEIELSESVNLNEETAVHGKYTIKSGPAVTGMGEGSPEHVKGHLGKLKQLGVSTEKGEKYGKTHRVSVTNNETGEKTHHHVYQREYYDKKPIVSVRDVGAGKKDQSAHHEVLKSYLSGKKADTAPVKEAVELGNEGDFKKAPKKFAKAPTQAKQGTPEGSLEVKEDLTEGTFKYHLDKAVAAHEKGDAKKKKFHLDNAKNAQYSMKSTEYSKNKDLFDKYKELTNEDLDFLDELSKTTLGNYVKDASSDRAGNSFTMGYEAGAGRQPKEKAHEHEAKRRKGISRAIDRLTREDVEITEEIFDILESLDEVQLDELSKETLKNYKDMVMIDTISRVKKGETSIPKADQRVKGVKAANKRLGESFADFIFDGEIIREELTYEINEANKNYDAYFKEMMKKAGITSIGDLKTDDAKKEFMSSVDAGFKAKNEEYVVENFMRADVEDKAAAHKKAGHKVSDIKFSTKDNKPHAEYTVTTADGDKKKYIYHGTARKLETLA